MAHKRTIGTVRPVRTEGGTIFDPRGRRVREVTIVPGIGNVALMSDDPVIDVVGRLTRPPTVTFPRPRYQTVDRPGAFGLTEYAGHDPYEMGLTLRFDGYPDRSIEPVLASLEALAERQPGTLEPPVIRVAGSVRHKTLRWRVTGLEEDRTQTLLDSEGRCLRLVVDVTLLQHVTDDLLTQSLAKTSKSKGIANRRWTVRPGEDTLFDVARHAYGDASRAADIARANSTGGRALRLAQQLTAGQVLRLP